MGNDNTSEEGAFASFGLFAMAPAFGEAEERQGFPHLFRGRTGKNRSPRGCEQRPRDPPTERPSSSTPPHARSAFESPRLH